MKIRFGFKNHLFVRSCINIFKLSNRSLMLCFSSNPTFTLLVFFKNKILYTFLSLTNLYYGRFEKAESNSFYLFFYICIHISINRIGVVISYTSICPPFLFVHINCIMERIKLSMGCLIKIIMISEQFANLDRCI